MLFALTRRRPAARTARRAAPKPLIKPNPNTPAIQQTNNQQMAYAATVDKLVRAYGYPSALRALPPFDWSYMARGLVIDKARGNVIKVIGTM